ncbi:unnamed protein product, partial [Prorocentrum cordatum]
ARMAMRPVPMKKVKKSSLLRKPKNAPYTRRGSSSVRSRLDRAAWARCLKDFVNATTMQVIDRLKKDKVLPEWKGAKCPYCQIGMLGPLKDHGKKKGGWTHTCSSDCCRRFLMPHAFHPIFKCGAGSSGGRLADQAAVLFCAVALCSQTSARLLLKNNHEMTEGIYSALYAARAKYVNSHEKNISSGHDQDGNALEWGDVEADEVDVAKGEGPNAGPRTQKPIIWEQWGGIVQRGNPRSLALFRLKPEKAKRRAPGPGLIRKRDWAPMASKWLKHRRAILHADGARSYKIKVDGVLHDWVVHKKKRVRVGGKWAWLKPAFTKIRYRDVPDQSKPSGTKRLWVKCGTQVIDRAWGDLRKAVGKGIAKTVLPGAGKVGGWHALRFGEAAQRDMRSCCSLSGLCKVRSFQWTYWNRGSDLWLATGQMLRDAWAEDH